MGEIVTVVDRTHAGQQWNELKVNSLNALLAHVNSDIEMGRIATEVKASCRGREWTEWMAKDAKDNPRTVRMHMAIFRASITKRLPAPDRIKLLEARADGLAIDGDSEPSGDAGGAIVQTTAADGSVESTVADEAPSVPAKPNPKDPAKPVNSEPTELDPADKAIEAKSVFRAFEKRIGELRKDIEAILPDDVALHMRTTFKSLDAHLKNAVQALKYTAPHRRCPYCNKKKGNSGCKVCKKSGWVSKGMWENFPADVKKAAE